MAQLHFILYMKTLINCRQIKNSEVTLIERLAGMPYTLLPVSEFVQVIKASN